MTKKKADEQKLLEDAAWCHGVSDALTKPVGPAYGVLYTDLGDISLIYYPENIELVFSAGEARKLARILAEMADDDY